MSKAYEVHRVSVSRGTTVKVGGPYPKIGEARSQLARMQAENTDGDLRFTIIPVYTPWTHPKRYY